MSNIPQLDLWRAIKAYAGADKQPRIPLSQAMERVHACLDQGADLNECEHLGWHVLQELAMLDEPGPFSTQPMIHALVELGANPLLGALGQCKSSSLAHALVEQATGKQLMDHQGANVLGAICRVAFSEEGWFPSLLQHALDQGADPFHLDHSGGTALHMLCSYAGRFGDPNMALFFQRSYQENPHKLDQLWEMASVLLQAGLSLDTPRSDGKTARQLLAAHLEAGLPLSPAGEAFVLASQTPPAKGLRQARL